MKRPDKCTVHRITTTLEAPLNRPKKTPESFGPYPCRVGKVTATLIKGQPQITLQTNLRLYINVAANIKKGDIAEVTDKYGIVTKYTIENVYRPGYHHTECDITIKEES